MMSVESFAKMLQPRVEARTPFLAYWHPSGMMVLNTGEYTVEEYDVMIGEPGKAKRRHAQSEAARDYIILTARRNGERVDDVRTVKRTHKVKASTVNKMRKIIAGLQKDPRIRQVYVVEFDGTNLIGEGPDPDVLSNLNVEVKP